MLAKTEQNLLTIREFPGPYGIFKHLGFVNMNSFIEEPPGGVKFPYL